MQEWFTQGLAAAQQHAQDAAVRARELASQATNVAREYAEQAAEQAKVMAQLAADEAQSRIAALKEAATAATSPPMASTETDLAYFGITDTLIERVEYMTYNTFSDAAVHTGPSSPDFKLSAFQEKHVLLVLKNVEQLQHLRYALCPKRMDEQQFWTVYFTLVKDVLPPQAFGLPSPEVTAEPNTTASPAMSKAKDAPVSSRANSTEVAGPGPSATPFAADKEEAHASQAVEAAPDSSSDLNDDKIEDFLAADGEYDDLDLEGLEDDPELCQYLQEALDIEDGHRSDDLGSDADDLDDYLDTLKDEDQETSKHEEEAD